MDATDVSSFLIIWFMMRSCFHWSWPPDLVLNLHPSDHTWNKFAKVLSTNAIILCHIGNISSNGHEKTFVWQILINKNYSKYDAVDLAFIYYHCISVLQENSWTQWILYMIIQGDCYIQLYSIVMYAYILLRYMYDPLCFPYWY